MVKIINDETRTFDFKVDIFVFDNSGYSNYTYYNCEIIFNNPIPVFNDESKQIGSVALDLEDNHLIGTFFIDYSSPERLNIQTRSIPMYPKLDCYKEISETDYGFNVTKMSINGVSLSMFPPEDGSIVPVR